MEALLPHHNQPVRGDAFDWLVIKPALVGRRVDSVAPFERETGDQPIQTSFGHQTRFLVGRKIVDIQQSIDIEHQISAGIPFALSGEIQTLDILAQLRFRLRQRFGLVFVGKSAISGQKIGQNIGGRPFHRAMIFGARWVEIRAITRRSFGEFGLSFGRQSRAEKRQKTAPINRREMVVFFGGTVVVHGAARFGVVRVENQFRHRRAGQVFARIAAGKIAAPPIFQVVLRQTLQNRLGTILKRGFIGIIGRIARGRGVGAGRDGGLRRRDFPDRRVGGLELRSQSRRKNGGGEESFSFHIF